MQVVSSFGGMDIALSKLDTNKAIVCWSAQPKGSCSVLQLSGKLVTSSQKVLLPDAAFNEESIQLGRDGAMVCYRKGATGAQLGRCQSINVIGKVSYLSEIIR